MPWERRLYRGNKAWILVDEAGETVLDDRQLASLRYKPEDERTYSIRPADLRPVPPPRDEGEETPPSDPIDVWADACVAAPGAPAGIGVVLAWSGRTREIARTLDPMPLPRAGVLAVVEGLKAIRKPALPVRVHTPHLETVRALRAGGREGARSPLAEDLRRTTRRFRNLRLLPVPDPGQEEHAARAAQLARHASDTSQGA